MKKRLLSLLLVFVLLFTLAPVQVFAVWPDDLSFDSLDESFVILSDAMTGLGKAADTTAEAASSFATMFKSFMSVASGVGSILAVVNGSVTFLKLIGVMEDPIKAGISSILNQLSVVNAKMSEMDSKLNDLASQMSQMQATVEFNARGEKALLLDGAWRDFTARYMEPMDALMAQYNAMLLSAQSAWCAGSRGGAVDNSSLCLWYRPDGQGGYSLAFTDENGVPSGCTGEDRYVTLSAELLPGSFAWDVNTYRAAFLSAVTANILDAAANGRFDETSAQNYPALFDGTITEADAAALASDALDLLAYRLCCAALASDISFVFSVEQQFAVYCQHLLSSNDGIDAMLKSLYLTHAFEGQIADDLTAFCNRMIVKTGVYGTFVANVLGCSHSASDEQKLSAMGTLDNAIHTLNEAKARALTGNDRYCYLTNTEVRYTDCALESSLTVNTYESGRMHTYKSFRASRINLNIFDNVPADTALIGDSNALLLFYTLQGNGVTDLHEYLRINASATSANKYGRILTSWKNEQTLAQDGSVRLQNKLILGDEYPASDSFYMNGDTPDPDYLRYSKKATGSVYDLATGELSSNKTLIAAAVWGESEWYWFTDEANIFAGPSNDPYYHLSFSRGQSGSNVHYDADIKVSYDVLLSLPLAASLQSADAYDPLAALAELNAELAAAQPSLGEPTAPAPIKNLSELDLSGTVLAQTSAPDDALFTLCLDRVETAAARDGAVISEKEANALAAELAAMAHIAENDIRTVGACFDDPFGFGQNSDALRSLADKIFGGAWGESVSVFSKLLCTPYPMVEFTCENDEWTPVLSMAYSAKPYLIVCDTASGAPTVTVCDLCADMQQGAAFSVRIPALDAAGDTARVIFYNASGEVYECGAIDAAISGDGIRYVDFVANGADLFRILSAPAEEAAALGAAASSAAPKPALTAPKTPSPDAPETAETAENNHQTLYIVSAILVIAAAAVYVVYRRKKKASSK